MGVLRVWDESPCAHRSREGARCIIRVTVICVVRARAVSCGRAGSRRLPRVSRPSVSDLRVSSVYRMSGARVCPRRVQLQNAVIHIALLTLRGRPQTPRLARDPASAPGARRRPRAADPRRSAFRRFASEHCASRRVRRSRESYGTRTYGPDSSGGGWSLVVVAFARVIADSK